jgi:MoaA/NifB/PqqE/SkfB family radical SAM enzyme
MSGQALFNRKDTRPSASMFPPDGKRYVCRWLDESLTIHSDGNVSCGLDDSHGLRSYGNIGVQTIRDIFANPEIDRVRTKLSQGHRCRDCGLFDEVGAGEIAPKQRASLPKTLIVEPTVKCNLRCTNASCVPNNLPGLQTRDAALLDVASFCRVVDEVQDSLEYVYFFNYGDPFVHKQAEEMLLYMRQRCPSVEIITSTNGIPLAHENRAAKVVESRLDHIVFTISGVHQKSYAKYHVNGELRAALKGMENICREKARLGVQKPRVVWRYLLFRWNDTDAELDEAIALAKTFGVDQFSLYLTHIPENSFSYRLSPGSPGFAKYRKYIDLVHGYQYPRDGLDEDGLYTPEILQGVGRARWTSWASKLHIKSPGRFLNLSLSTIRPHGQDAHEVFVTTPWQTYKYRLISRAWRSVSIYVPKAFRRTNFTIELITPGYWFPVDYGSEDYRCLGCLVAVSADGTIAKSPIPLGLLRGSRVQVNDASERLRQLSSIAFDRPVAFDGAGMHSAAFAKTASLPGRVPNKVVVTKGDVDVTQKAKNKAGPVPALTPS